MKRGVYFDFEYNSRGPLCAVLLVRELGQQDQEHRFDLRGGQDTRRLLQAVEDHQDSVWLAYAACADLDQLARLGVDIRHLLVIDLMAEARMITRSHPDIYTAEGSLAAQVEAFGLPTIDETHKEAMRDLILSRSSWSDEEFDSIIGYCASDVRALPALLREIAKAHRDAGTPWTLNSAVVRGEHIKATTILEARSAGIPVDEAWFDHVWTHRDVVSGQFCQEANEHFGQPLYVKQMGGRWSFKMAAFEKVLKALNLHDFWLRTTSGRLKTEQDYITEMCRACSALEPFKRAHDMQISLRAKEDMRLLLRDGALHPHAFPFGGLTGRNQGRPRNGFVLNSAPYLRSIIAPKRGRVIVSRDWSKQEPAISAWLSQDEAMLSDYGAADLYCAMGQQFGLLPFGEITDDYKRQNDIMRQLLKAMTLGVGYGMGQATLGQRVFAAAQGGQDLFEANKLASEFVERHRRVYSTYWSWVRGCVTEARRNGWIDVEGDGWLRFASRAAPTTALGNFRVQANGARMMRIATRIMAFETGLDLMASHHDALYVNADEKDAEDVQRALVDIMDRAAAEVVGSLEIKGDVKVLRYPHRHDDKRGAAIVSRFEGLR